ncbi:hypothetical protein TNCV_412411 [Trichonephila clavipes]|uniref:Uncharacterized protein n=1 Tax=Trichonephila clavipes TaxID=2585209 RepID=A0A8X6S4S3_TRICX|nr:hypothetical protein TNCV_412411 [Trichonephila clavipes]
MKIDRDGRRNYRNCNNCLDIELTPAYIYDYPAILAALQEIQVLFPTTNLYVDNIQQIGKKVILVHGIVLFDTVMSTISSSYYHLRRQSCPVARRNSATDFRLGYMRIFLRLFHQILLELLSPYRLEER